MVKTKMLFVLSLLILVLLSAVSAVDDAEGIVLSDGETLDNYDLILSQTDETLLKNSISVNEANYGNYFDDGGNLKSNVNNGDELIIDGDFNNKKFNINKNITVTGGSSNNLKNCMLLFDKGSSGSTISGLTISNTNDDCYGIFINSASFCTIKGCIISSSGKSSYPISLGNGASNNSVINNILHTEGISYGHNTRSTPPLVVVGSHYNYIANNKITCDDANGIYLSNYGGGPVSGGNSNFNIIYNNTIKYNVLPTSWSYGIQMMGSYNNASFNTIIGAFRGISSQQGSNNYILNNRIINITGANYNNPTVEEGGEAGIVGSSSSIIKNNLIENALISASGAGIGVIDDSIVENNTVKLINNGHGIKAEGNNVHIRNNNIYTNNGAGVYYKDESFNLLVESNNITSRNGVGVLIESLSRNRMPSNITIIYNTINTSNVYAIDANQANKENFKIKFNNNISGIIRDPNGIYDPSKPEFEYNNSKIIEITEEDYSMYISNDGNLIDVEDGSILKFKGVFNDKIIFVNKGIKIIGENAVFYNSTFKVTSGNVWIENIKIDNSKASRLNAWGILVYDVVNGVKIIENDISVSDKNAAYAIYILQSSYVDVIGNKLSSSGDLLTYTLLGHTVQNCNFSGNEIYTRGTGELYSFEFDHCLDGGENCIDGNHSEKEIYRTYGILMMYSSFNYISNNHVNVTSSLSSIYGTTGQNASSNSLVGIDIYYNSNKNVVSNNEVIISGNDNYIYGVGVLGWMTTETAPQGKGAFNNSFIGNKITLKGSYFTSGVIVGSYCEDTLINNNEINLISGVSYGINLERSQKSSMDNNKITLNSEVVYAIKADHSNNNIISKNSIGATGNQVYGILIADSINNKIDGNNIAANGSGEVVSFKNLDSDGYGNAGIKLSQNSSGNKIINNKIFSNKGYAISIGNLINNTVIENNYLESEMGNSTSAIDNIENVTVSRNYIYNVTGKIEGFMYYLEEGNLTFKTEDENLEGANVTFYIFSDYLGKSVVSNGVASIKFNLPHDYYPTQYLTRINVLKTDYKDTTLDYIFNISPGRLIVIVQNVTTKDGLQSNFIAKVTNILGQPISGITVNFYAEYSNYRKMGESGKTNANGVVNVVLTVPDPLDGEWLFKAEAVVDNDKILGHYESTNATGKITILDIAPVTIKLNSNLGFGGILATLTDNNGFAVSNKNVNVNIGGKNVNVKTNSLGQIILPSVNPGSYNVVLTSNDDGTYAYASVSGKINVAAPITGNAGVTVYYGSTVNYKVRITGSDGNYVGVGHNVIIKVGKTIYKVATDSKGYATKSIKQSAGTYTVTATYKGYTVSNKITFKPTLTAKNIAKKKGKTIKFSAKLVNKNGKILKSKKVTFKIKGKTYKVKTNKKGVATVTIKLKLKVGKYTIKSSYGGCTISNKITIKK